MIGNPSPKRSPATEFKPGNRANPGGKPVRARNAITQKFLEALAKDFDGHGEQAVRDARMVDPLGYVRVVASLLPKEFSVERPLEGLSDEELEVAIADLRGRIGNVH